MVAQVLWRQRCLRLLRRAKHYCLNGGDQRTDPQVP